MSDAGAPMVILIDAHPSSQGALALATRLGGSPIALRSWKAADLNRAAPAGPDVVELESTLADPTISEALAAAAAAGTPWVALRRDFTDPHSLLSGLLLAAGRHNDDDIPGFAVLLADGMGPVRRILGVVDRTHGPISGLLAHAAVSVAETTGAAIDILVIGASGESVSSDDELAALAISRESELYDLAVERASKARLQVNWIAAGAVAEPWTVVADQLSQEQYDLVVDDLGDVTVGRMPLGRGFATDALDRGNVGEIPLRLLTQTDTTLLLVIDEIRLGLAPPAMLRAGAVAAVTLGVLAGGGVIASPAATADQTVATAEAHDVSRQLEAALRPTPAEEPQAAQAEAEQATQETTEGEAEQVGATAPPAAPPPEDATPEAVAEAQRDAKESKADVKDAKEEREEALEDLEEADEELAAAQEQAQAALDEILAAEAEVRESTLEAGPMALEQAALEPALPAVMGTEQVDAEQAAAQAQAEQEAHEALDRLSDAAEAGTEALADLEAAKQEVAASQAALDEAEVAQAQAEAEYQAQKELADAYAESLADSRAVPAESDYEVTAHYGESGSSWSTGYHTGMDFACPTGTDVVAAADGTVVSAGWAGAYGYQVVIQHEDGYTTTYSHLSDIDVAVGDEVSVGDHIGDVGATGNTTGSHLHFEVTKDGKYIDPEYWLGW